MILEVCGDSFEAALMASKYGAQRIELCCALDKGGLTPSFGLIEQCASIENLEVHVMIRHQEGGFVYAEEDIKIMESDILAAKVAGADGVVFGCLTKDHAIHVEQNQRLISKAQNQELECTFHRAYDLVQNPEEALEEIIFLGFDRILTSGQAEKVDEGLEGLANALLWSNGRIEVMAGSGVNAANLSQLIDLGIAHLHFTIHQKEDQKANFGMGNKKKLDEDKIRSIAQQFNKA